MGRFRGYNRPKTHDLGRFPPAVVTRGRLVPEGSHRGKPCPYHGYGAGNGLPMWQINSFTCRTSQGRIAISPYKSHAFMALYNPP